MTFFVILLWKKQIKTLPQRQIEGPISYQRDWKLVIEDKLKNLLKITKVFGSVIFRSYTNCFYTWTVLKDKENVKESTGENTPTYCVYISSTETLGINLESE